MPLHVVIAGGGVAGLEALLALRDLAGDRVDLTLLDPGDVFRFRPLTVAEPFAAAPAPAYPLADVVAHAGARHMRAGVAAVNPARHRVRLTTEEVVGYDVLVLAVGATARPAYANALTFDPDDTTALAALVDELQHGRVGSVAVVVPPGPHWVLPAYELALLLAQRARPTEAEVLVVTPEPAPLALFGTEAAAAVTADLEEAGVQVRAATSIPPGGALPAVERVVALPEIRPRPIPGVPAGSSGFLDVDAHGRVRALADVYAAGDGTSFALKQGGLAAQQADAVARHVAHRAGAAVEPEPFAPVLRGRLLTGGKDRWLRRDISGPDDPGRIAAHSLWWPPGKVAGTWLAPYLATRDAAAAGLRVPPPHGRLTEVELPQSGDVPLPRDLELLGFDE